MAAQSPLRRPATLQDSSVCLKGIQPLQNGSSKMAEFCRAAGSLGFFLWHTESGRWIVIISITFAFFSPPTKEQIILEEEFRHVFLLILFLICMPSFLYGPNYFQPSPRRWTNYKWGHEWSSYSWSTNLKVTLGLELESPEKVEELLIFCVYFCETPILSLCYIAPTLRTI